MIYALLAVSVVTLIGLIILFVMVFKMSKNKPSADSSISEKELGAISQQIKSLQEAVQKDIQIALAKEMLQVNETNNQKLERFQTSIIEQMTARFEAINLQLSEKMKEINQKVEDKLKEGFQGTSETMA